MHERQPLMRGPKVWEGFVPPADIPTDQLWTKDFVQQRLVEAAKLIERTSGRVTPKEFGSSMPNYTYDWGDLLGQAQNATLNKGNRITIGASSRAVTRYEQAIRWPLTYLERHEGMRRVLMLFLRCRAFRIPFTVALKRKGWNKATCYRLRDKALTIIAIGLINDRVPLVLAGDDDDEREPIE